MAHTDEGENARRDLAGGLFLAGFVSFLLAIPAIIELALAISPGVKVYATYGTLCGLLVLWLRAPRRTSLFIVAVIFLGLTILHVVPWTSRKVFLRHFGEIRVGMATEKVLSIMRGYGYREVPHGSGMIDRAFFHSRTGRFDSDCGVVTFVEGRVIKAEFSPD